MANDKRIDIINDVNIDFQGKPILVFYGFDADQLWVQVGMERPDCDDPTIIGIGKGGKEKISRFATEDEIVKKILGLALRYVEHETREGFYYKGVRLFGPHISLDAMMSIAHLTVGREVPVVTN